MPEDPIVDEIHRIRQELLEEHGGFDGYLQHLQQLQEDLKDRIVTHAPRRPVKSARKVS